MHSQNMSNSDFMTRRKYLYIFYKGKIYMLSYIYVVIKHVTS